MLIQGDCYELLASTLDVSTVDAVICDPPYGTSIDKMGFTNNRKGGVALRNDYADTKAWDRRVDLEPFLSIGKIQVIFGGNFYTDVLPPSRCWFVWDKKEGGYYSNDFADCEMAWTNLDKPSRIIRYLWHGMIQQNMKQKEKRYHPSQKPIEVMKQIIEATTEKGDLVFDPFMGSGSTGVACVETSREFIGIEKDATYFQIAKERIGNAQPPLLLAKKPIASVKQTELL